ncbi:hypothetical protein LT679_18380 [Mucilaginibacter roseus]|uniref:Uncharacterized protein n=1 Tax=Mucilaginibacter roseus TaxID=1528868 RepID=A0ABS8U950_9SPHI|nr:hypothetical protein [Mucilaginibacter roseus]MCD8742584.1 hypothetical protein [Mucilaginibacter roseus]
MKIWLLFTLVALYGFKASAQCAIDKSIITNNSWRTTVHHARYIGNAPSYVFAAGGDTAANWNVLRKPIDIKQIPEKALVYKKRVEDSIISYSGKAFFNDLRFISAEVVYPDRVEHFRQHGRPDILQMYTATYLYTYRTEVDSLAYVDFEFPVNGNGDLMDWLIIPQKGKYRPVIKKVDYCKLIKVAGNAANDLFPVGEISFEYDMNLKNFNWIITHKSSVVQTESGKYSIRNVRVDAADLGQVTPGFTTQEVIVDYIKLIPKTTE